MAKKQKKNILFCLSFVLFSVHCKNVENSTQYILVNYDRVESYPLYLIIQNLYQYNNCPPSSTQFHTSLLYAINKHVFTLELCHL